MKYQLKSAFGGKQTTGIVRSGQLPQNFPAICGKSFIRFKPVYFINLFLDAYPAHPRRAKVSNKQHLLLITPCEWGIALYFTASGDVYTLESHCSYANKKSDL
uniref:Uncharacterized protein n=1 Tax=Sphaerodactylus townsendi TaxID=933632 RepID=A0ACB8FB12_9SAUR